MAKYGFRTEQPLLRVGTAPFPFTTNMAYHMGNNGSTSSVLHSNSRTAQATWTTRKGVVSDLHRQDAHLRRLRSVIHP